MQTRLFLLIIWPMIGLLGSSLAAQDLQIRPEDHFYRRKVINRIDLNEKVNQPLIQREAAIYGDNSNIEKQGLVGALLMGLEQGRFMAYHPDDMSRPMTYEEVLARIQELDFSGEEEEIWETDDLGGESEFITEDDFPAYDDPFATATSEAPSIDYAAFESVIQFVEDRIFDKNRGEMVYKYDYFQLIWTDPGETLPEKELCVFRYADISETLDEVVWINRHNDAERRSIKEVFDLRLFNSFIINVSGSGVLSLSEAERRRQQLVEYEHHLWNY
ncbi:MAG: hypothetical protein AB8H47_04360 [Bacteroidia bacterium]